MEGSPVPPYGTAIQDATASGDLELMKSVSKRAEEHLREFGDVADGLRQLRQEIARLESTRRAGAADVVPYGDPMRAALASGDIDQMREMVRVGEEWLSRVEDVREALRELKEAVAGLEAGEPH